MTMAAVYGVQNDWHVGEAPPLTHELASAGTQLAPPPLLDALVLVVPVVAVLVDPAELLDGSEPPLPEDVASGA